MPDPTQSDPPQIDFDDERLLVVVAIENDPHPDESESPLDPDDPIDRVILELERDVQRIDRIARKLRAVERALTALEGEASALSIQINNLTN